MLVAVGDVEGIEVLQGTSLIRQPHGRDAFQDLIQLLLTRGLRRAEKTERQITHVIPNPCNETVHSIISPNLHVAKSQPNT